MSRHRDYTECSLVIAQAIEKVSGQPLTEVQYLALSGSLPLLLNKEFNEGRESIVADFNNMNGASRG